MIRTLVTGATGFIGQQLCELLSLRGYRVRAALRTDRELSNQVPEKIVVGEIGAQTDWTRALDGVECVVHCAALAHVIGGDNSLSTQYVECNAHGTENLLRACAEVGVRRFVYLSSIKVNGEATAKGSFSRSDQPNPTGAYAMSKWQAEKHVVKYAATSSMGTAIVRPPLVYGPEVRANFLRLMRWVDSGLPLPLGAAHNCRSLVNVWNLCDLIERLLRDANRGSVIYMVSDGEDISTSELVRRIGVAMKRRANLIPVPMFVLRMLGSLSGRKAELDRLCGTLTVDISATCSELGWRPPVSVDEGLARTARWYLSRGGRP